MITRLKKRLIEAVDDLASWKVQLSFILLGLAYISNWNIVMSIVAGVNIFLVIWVREIQKPKNELAQILKKLAERK
jgi:hypothetical protein